MKKSIVISIVMFLIITVFTGNVNAASATVNVGVNNSTPEIGNTITITISFSQPVGTASLNLNYNNSIVQYTGSNAWKASDRGTAVKLDYIDTDFENKTITSMTVTFKVIGTGTANFTVSNIVISNASGEELTANISGGATINVIQNAEGSTEIPSTPGSTPGTGSNTNKKPNTSTSTNKKPNTNTNTSTNNTNNVTTQPPQENNTDLNNTMSSEINSNENNNQVKNDISNTEQTEIKANEENKPNYIAYVMFGIIVLAIIVIIIVIICKLKNDE